VVWTSPTRQGIRFTNLSEQYAKAIKAFIADVDRPE
jgi:hypothetical protein